MRAVTAAILALAALPAGGATQSSAQSLVATARRYRAERGRLHRDVTVVAAWSWDGAALDGSVTHQSMASRPASHARLRSRARAARVGRGRPARLRPRPPRDRDADRPHRSPQRRTRGLDRERAIRRPARPLRRTAAHRPDRAADRSGAACRRQPRRRAARMVLVPRPCARRRRCEHASAGRGVRASDPAERRRRSRRTADIGTSGDMLVAWNASGVRARFKRRADRVRTCRAGSLQTRQVGAGKGHGRRAAHGSASPLRGPHPHLARPTPRHARAAP